MCVRTHVYLHQVDNRFVAMMAVDIQRAPPPQRQYLLVLCTATNYRKTVIAYVIGMSTWNFQVPELLLLLPGFPGIFDAPEAK